MAHWLKIPVIAEGVETKGQADYLKSLGCVYMQGYHFARPMPAQDFETFLCQSHFHNADRYSSINLEGIAAFWDPSAQTALLFNSFVGGAAILEYENGNLSVIRANNRFYQELDVTRERYLDKQQHTLDCFDETNATMYVSMLNEAIQTGDEAECDLQNLPVTDGASPFWTHNRVRLLAKNGGTYLFYLSIENITARKNLEKEREAENERNQLLMKSTGTSFFDYDCITGTLTYHAYLPNKGIKVFVIPRYQDYVRRCRLFSPEGVSSILSILGGDIRQPVSGELEYRANLWKTGMRWYRARYAKVADQSGNVYRFVGQVDDIQSIKEREALSEALQQRLNAKSYKQNFDEIIVNQIFNLFYESSDIIGAIETTLALLGEYYNLSRAYIFEDSDDHQSATNTFEWCAPDVAPQIGSLQDVPYAQMGGREKYVAYFDKNDMYYCGDILSLESDALAILEPQGIRSMLQFAIRDNGVYSGMIGFDECREERVWTDSELGTLAFVSRIIALFLLRRRQSDSVAFSSDFRAALDDNAVFAYIIDPQTYSIIYINQMIQNAHQENFIGRTCYEAFIGRSEPCVQCPVRRLYDTNGPHIAEVTRKDGMVMLSQASKLRWNGHNMAMLSCIDITESKMIERALVTEKQKTDLALTAANLTLWTYDIQNDSFTITRGGNDNHLLGETIVGAYRAALNLGMVMEDSVQDYIALHEAILNGASTASATIHCNPDIVPSEWMKVTYTAIPGDDGKANSAIAIALDVTAQILAEERYLQETEYRKTIGRNCILTMRINVTDDIIEDMQTAAAFDFNILSGMKREDVIPHLTSRLTNDTDSAHFQEFFTAEYLQSTFARGETQLQTGFCTENPSGGIRYFMADVQMLQRPGDGSLIAFIAIHDETAQTLIRRMMEKLIDASYDYIAYIDAQTKRFELFVAHAKGGDVLPEKGENFNETAKYMLQRNACKNDVERAIQETNLTYVAQQLSDQPEFVCRYRSTPETGSRVRQLVFRPLGADGRQILLTRQDVTALIEEDIRSDK